MKHFLRYIVLSFALSFTLSANAEPMRNGKWEVITQTIMPHVLTQLPAHNDVLYIDNKNRGKSPIAVHESCEFQNYKITNNNATWQMICKGDLRMTGVGKITFSTDSYTGSAIVKMKMPQSEPMEIDHIYSGKRIGDC
ncbi:DUF3617 family protein [Nitrosomonas sp.]|uniref:DUF3617 domain-containing protein n=1 Tax=Nitrosomonas sp. TaxID=42353 RepID=UPI0032EB0F60